jgi:hypothetical protein
VIADRRPDPPAITRCVREFLTERGRSPNEEGTLALGSLEYVALLLHLETALGSRIDDATFFGDGLPETLHAICDRVALATGAR